MPDTITPDFTTKPYAEWLEEVLSELFQHDPVSIGIVMILDDGSIGTNYYNVDCTDMTLMANAMHKDEQINWMKVNRDYILEILNDDETEEEEEEDETEE